MRDKQLEALQARVIERVFYLLDNHSILQQDDMRYLIEHEILNAFYDFGIKANTKKHETITESTTQL